MDYAELLNLNGKLAGFAACIPAELDGRFELQRYAPYQIIHQKDSVLERIGILLEGAFRVVNEFENGNVFMIERNDAVSFVGEVTLLAGASTTSVTIEAVTECLIAYLPVKVFDAWLKADPDFLRVVSRHVAAKLYHASYDRGERLFYSAKYLLLKYIVGHVKNTKWENDPFVIKKTRRQIGEEVGMTIKTINRTLAGFCQEALISMERGKIAMTKAQYAKAGEALHIYMAQSRNGSY